MKVMHIAISSNRRSPLCTYSSCVMRNHVDFAGTPHNTFLQPDQNSLTYAQPMDNPLDSSSCPKVAW